MNTSSLAGALLLAFFDTRCSEPAGSEHLVSKNASSSAPAKLLVFMVLAPDEQILIPLEKP